MKNSYALFYTLILLMCFSTSNSFAKTSQFTIVNKTKGEIKINFQTQSPEAHFYGLHDFKESSLSAEFGNKEKDTTGNLFVGFDAYQNGKHMGGCTYKFTMAYHVAYYHPHYWNMVTLIAANGSLKCPKYFENDLPKNFDLIL